MRFGFSALAGTVAFAGLLTLPSCSFPRVVHDLHTHAPPAELGRPGWVRGVARFGSWVGAVGGAVASVAVLPITYPISLLADEPLGYSRDEFLFAPLTAGASTGHFILGAPADLLHWLGYRAWVDEPRPTGYDFVPMAPPAEPGEIRPEGGGEGGSEADRAGESPRGG